MFCYQCQEAANGVGCKFKGVCGKEPEVAKLQDLLIHSSKGLALVNSTLRKIGKADRDADKAILNSLFITITNANFDDKAIAEEITKNIKLRKKLEIIVIEEKVEFDKEFVGLLELEEGSVERYTVEAENVGVLRTENEDVRSLRELITYGLKGMAAYGMHAYHLGKIDDEILAFLEKALLGVNDSRLNADELIALTLETGNYGVKVMALLDEANTGKYGNPEITKVNIGVRNNPAILISGHDLKDLEQLLEQTKGTGVDVYTHSEMLPANYYPFFKKYDNLVGNYGNAWWKQNEEFESFNGPVLFTTNCIVPPKSKNTYGDRIYTTNAAGYPNWKHIIEDENGNKDFSEIIEHAKKLGAPTEIETGEIVGGFAHAQVFALADKVVDAVKSGAIKKFFVMAGCDGRMKSRDYYTEFAEKLPKDTVILTAGCAKYRYNKLPLGDIGGIPRVLDAGQCNDSYSLAVIALKLKEVFELNDINELPIAYNIAWYEQKAVIVLLALLALGVKNIHLGPTLPAFLSPNVAKVIVDTFGIAGIGTVDEDIKAFME
jgi:hydroxylamine reductase